MIKQTGDSLLLSKHSIQLQALFLLLSAPVIENFLGLSDLPNPTDLSELMILEYLQIMDPVNLWTCSFLVGFIYTLQYSLSSTSSILEQSLQSVHHLQMTKSQIILKGLFGIIGFFQKRTNKFVSFRRIRGYQKSLGNYLTFSSKGFQHHFNTISKFVCCGCNIKKFSFSCIEIR